VFSGKILETSFQKPRFSQSARRRVRSARPTPERLASRAT
jgi:hypothetical protein